MNDIIEDLIKIYQVCVDSYTPKCYQIINNKYTIIDKCILTTYLYISILENKKLENQDATQVLSNYLIKQLIYSEIGNIQFDFEDMNKVKVYNNVIDNVICDRFQYMNRIMKKIKYPFNPTGENEYVKLIDFLENIVDYAILKKVINRGNKEAEDIYTKKYNKIKQSMDFLVDDDIFFKEKTDLINLIINDNFEDNQYGNLINVALNLRDVYRFSLINSRVNENVLFHQYTAAVTSLCLATYCNQNLKEQFNIYKILKVALFHDFGEYKGTEITSHIKKYNNDTKKIFAEIEENYEKELQGKIGDNIYKYITAMKKDESESYVCDFMDKMLPYIKTWIEIKYYNNYNYIRLTPLLYRQKLKKFSRINNIEGIKDKEFFLNLLVQYYIYLKQDSIDCNMDFLSKYFLENEIIEFRKEIEALKNNPESFFD